MKRAFIFIVLLTTVAGCTSYRTEAPRTPATVPLLSTLQPGKTTRDELRSDWGPPAANLQAGRIVFYRLEGRGQQLRFSQDIGSWEQGRHSLVLIFDSAGVLEKSSLVRIQ